MKSDYNYRFTNIILLLFDFDVDGRTNNQKRNIRSSGEGGEWLATHPKKGKNVLALVFSCLTEGKGFKEAEVLNGEIKSCQFTLI